MLFHRDSERDRRLRVKLVEKASEMFQQETGSSPDERALVAIRAGVAELVERRETKLSDLSWVVSRASSAFNYESRATTPLNLVVKTSTGERFPRAESVPLPNLLAPTKAASPWLVLNPSASPRPKSPLLPPAQTRKFNEQIAGQGWDGVVSRDVEEYRREQREERQRKQRAVQRQRELLDTQVEADKRRREEEREQDNRSSEIEVRQRAAWEAEKLREEQERQKSRYRERELIQEQMQAQQQRKKEEQLRHRREEEEQVAVMGREEANRRLLERQKRDAARQDIAVYLDYNRKLCEQKRQEQQQEKEKDRKFLRDYAEFMEEKDTQFRRSVQELSRRHQLRSAVVDRALSDSPSELSRRETAKADVENNSLLEKAIQRETAAQLQAAERNAKLRSDLQKQIAERENQKRLEAEESQYLKLLLDSEAEQQRRSTRNNAQNRRQNAAARARELQEQVSAATAKARLPMEIKIGSVSPMFIP
eukprot:TRINITY_DN6519_c0_g1_i1.p1 TRINITY_DN6519_c0_g1~~TRINITY_DN6519_c0_g1_i1.p1  ORF type:complete len:480 (-),score=110.32 TRINITY_DN6519_c0_g1_i1:23-1462(-)